MLVNEMNEKNQLYKKKMYFKYHRVIELVFIMAEA